MSVPYLAQAAEHEQLQWLGGGIMQILLDGQTTGGQLTMVRSAAEGGSASPVHVHAGEDEIVVLLQGSGIFWAGDQRWELSEGGVAFLPRNVPHAYRITSPTADMLAVATPAGFEDFVRAAGWDLSRPRPDGWDITPASMAAAAAATGQTILGPPLAADQMIPHAYLTGQPARPGKPAVTLRDKAREGQVSWRKRPTCQATGAGGATTVPPAPMPSGHEKEGAGT